MALKSFNVQGGLSIGTVGDIFDANANLNLTANIPNVALGNVGNLHISGGLAYVAVGTANVFANGAVDTITLSNVGIGYDIAPTITITGANTGTANITATLAANGSISGFTYTGRGSGYANGTIGVTISSPGTKYLKTDGAGNLAWYEVQATGGSNVTPGGTNTAVQFNDNANLGGSNVFTFDKTTGALAIGNVITLQGNTSANGSNVAVATITSAATSSFDITGGANASLTVKASNGAATITSNGSGGNTTVSYADANANLTAARVVASANTVSISAVANASAVSANSSSITVGSDSGVTVTSANGNVSVGVTVDNNSNGSKANVIISNASVNLSAAANGANTTGNSASLGLSTTGITATAANGNVVLATSVQGNANGAQGNVTVSTAAITLQTASNAANTDANSSSITLGTTGGITATSANGNVTVGVTSASNANGAQANARISNTAITLTAAANAAANTANSASITVGTSQGVSLQSSNANVTLAVTTAGNANAATANTRISNGIITLSGAANASSTSANTASILIDGPNSYINISANGQSNIFTLTSNGTHAQTTIDDDVTITGNLTVQGDAIYANVTVLQVQDPLIELGTGANGAPLTSEDGWDRGIVMHSFGDGTTKLASSAVTTITNTIPIANTVGITAGMKVLIANYPGIIPVNTTVSTINTNANVILSQNITGNIGTDASNLISFGTDLLRFMGWDNSNAEITMAANVTEANNVISYNALANVRALNYIGNITGNLTGNTVVLKANNGSDVRQVTLQASTDANFTANYTITLPTTDGATDQYLQTNGSGVTTWADVSTLKNGNSNVVVAANSAVTISANGVANIVTVNATSSLNTITLGTKTTSAGGITDAGPSGYNLTSANLTTSSSVPSGGTNQSIVANGVSRLSLTSGTTGSFTSADAFTHEFYLYADGNSLTNNSAIMFQSSGFSGSDYAGIRLGTDGNIQVRFGQGISGANQPYTGNTAITANTWVHVAAVNDPGNSTQKLYIGGQLAGNAANLSTTTFYFGSFFNQENSAGTANLEGRLYNYRVSNSVRYTANFTPSATYGVDSNTVVFIQGTAGGNTYAGTTEVANIVAYGNVNLTNSSNVSLGPIGNLRITGGSSGQVLTTNGSGNVSFANIASAPSDFAVSGELSVNSTKINSAGLTTTTTTANQTLATWSAGTLRNASEVIIWAQDTAGEKYFMSTYNVLYYGNNNVDFAGYGQISNGATVGTINFTASSGNVNIVVTPASTNSTVWTAQWRSVGL